MIPYDDIFKKKTLEGKSSSVKLFAISPLVFISLRDFLSVFSKRLRYIDAKPIRAI